MPSPVDAAYEVAMLEIDDDEQDVGRGRNGINSEAADIVADRKAIHEIALMADRMTLMVQEIRNTNVETDRRLQQVEADLKLIELESRNG
jgi:hypothetical protein